MARPAKAHAQAFERGFECRAIAAVGQAQEMARQFA